MPCWTGKTRETSPHEVGASHLMRHINCIARCSILLVTIFCCLSGSIFAQDITAHLLISPTPSPYYGDWDTDPTIAQLELTYTGIEPLTAYVYLEVISIKNGIIGYGTSRNLEFPEGPFTLILTTPDIIDWDEATFNEAMSEMIVRTNRIPEDDYTAYVTVHDLNGNVLVETSTEFSILYPDPPQLIYPDDESVVEMQTMTFQWSPIALPFDQSIVYHFKIVEMLSGQEPQRALDANTIHYETQIEDVSSIDYPIDALPFEHNKTYVWRVQALDFEGLAIASNDGLSEIWTFRYVDSQADSPIESLEEERLALIPGFAYLEDMANLNVEHEEADIILNGIARINLEFNEIGNLVFDVNVNDLRFDAQDLIEPKYLDGSITCDLAGINLPRELTSQFLQLSDLRFDAVDGLTVGGEIVFPLPAGDQHFAMNTRLSVYPEGLDGVVKIDASEDDPLFNLRESEFGFNITSLSISFPDPDVRMDATFRLFDDAVIFLNNLQVSGDGVLTCSIDGNFDLDIPLAGDSDLLTMQLSTIDGDFYYDFHDGHTNYNILIPINLEFKFNETEPCAAEALLTISPQGLSVSAFHSSCGINNRSINLGWLMFDLQTLDFVSLNYANQVGWNFEFLTDIQIQFPGIPDLKVPTIKDIWFNNLWGFTFPEMNWGSLPEFEWGAFFIKPTSVKLPSFEFDWFNSSAGAVNPFQFSFDIDLSFSAFSSNIPECLRSSGIRIQNAKIKNGTISADIEANIIEEPGCPIPLGGGAIFHLTELSGKVGGSLSPQGAKQENELRFSGNLTLPEMIQCEGNADQNGIENIELLLDENGLLTGHISLPVCSMQMGFFSVTIETATLIFEGGANGQQIVFEGDGRLELPSSTPGEVVSAAGFLRYDIVNGRLLEGSFGINSPFVWNIPATPPHVLSFRIQSATIDESGVLINGIGELLLEGQSVSVTFNNALFDLSGFNLISGSVEFGSTFAFHVDLESMVWQAVETGNEVASGLMLNLPSDIAIRDGGLAIGGGSSNVAIAFFDQQLAGVQATYSDDFVIGFSPFGIFSGSVDFIFEDKHVGYLDKYGFNPDPSFFVGYLPEILPLPSRDIAYLKLKEQVNGEWIPLITFDTESNQITILEGKFLPFHFPCLKGQGDTEPVININFELLEVNDNWSEVLSGNFTASIGEAAQNQEAFDLSNLGIPFRISEVAYSAVSSSDSHIQLTGEIIVFDEISGQVILELTDSGALSGEFNVGINKSIPLLPDSNRLKITLQNVLGVFRTGENFSFDYELTVNSELEMVIQEGTPPGKFSSTIRITPSGTEFVAMDLEDIGVQDQNINLGLLELKIHELALEQLSYNESGEWYFEGSADMDVNCLLGSGLGIQLPDIRFDPRGLRLPPLTINCPLDCEINLGLFTLKNCSIQLNSFDFPFSWEWPEGGGGRVSGLGKIKIPDLIPDCLKNMDLNIDDVKLTNNKLSADIDPVLTGEPGCPIPLGGGIVLTVQEVSGSVDLSVGTDGFEHNDSLFVKAKLTIPDIFKCDQQASELDLMQTKLSIDNQGLVQGTVNNIIPPCPIPLGILNLRISQSDILFEAKGSEQSVVLSASGEMNIPELGENGVRVSGNIDYDLVDSEIRDGNLSIDNPFTIGFPAQDPVLSFQIDQASLNKSGLRIDGSNKLTISEDVEIGVSFNDLLIDLDDFDVKEGRIDFNQSFAFKLGLTESSNQIDWACVAGTSTLGEELGMLLQLPMSNGFDFYLDSLGIHLAGSASAALKWSDTELNLAASFSTDFAIDPASFEVSSGIAELFLDGRRVAYINQSGFFPDPSFFLNLLPEKIGLPVESMAYLKLRGEDNELLIQTEAVDGGVRIWTEGDQGVELGMPIMSSVTGTTPILQVLFPSPGLTINFGTMSITEGSIAVDVAGLDGFDLTPSGIPFVGEQLVYVQEQGDYVFKIGGLIRLFEEELGSAQLSISSAGILSGEIGPLTDITVPLIPGSDNMEISLTELTGSMDTNLNSGTVSFALSTDGQLKLNLDPELPLSIGFRLTVDQNGADFDFSNPEIENLETPFDLELIQLLLSNISIPEFTYTEGEFDFELGFDLDFQFPHLFGDSEIAAAIQGAILDPTGIRINSVTVSLPTDTVDLLAFQVLPTEFRLNDVEYNWFEQDAPNFSEWGMSFDFTILLPEFPETSVLRPLSALNLDILQLVYDGGILTGDMEPIELTGNDIVTVPIAGGMELSVTGLDGSLFNTNNRQDGNIEISGTFSPPSFLEYEGGEAAFSLNVTATGEVTGGISNFPACALDINPILITMGQSSLDFSFTASDQSAELSVASAQVQINTGDGSIATGSGQNIRFDLMNLKLLEGEFAITSAFTWKIPQENPVLVFNLQSAVLNQNGLVFNGASTLSLAEGQSVGLTFRDFTIALPSFEVVSGSAGFDASFGFELNFASGLDYEAIASDYVSSLSSGLALMLPEVGLSEKGILVTGTSSVTFRWQDEEYTSVAARFLNDEQGKPFLLSYDPFEVSSGKVEFYWRDENNADRLVATIDNQGFHPGDLLGFLPLPGKLPLGDEEIAYIQIRENGSDDGDLLIESLAEAGNFILRTRAQQGGGVTLFIPALEDQLNEIPEVLVTFEVVVDGSFSEFVSGSITAELAEGQESLFSLDNLGIPIDVTRLSWDKVDQNYALSLNLNPDLPDALEGLDLKTSCTVGASGLTGTAAVSCQEDLCSKNFGESAFEIGFSSGQFSFSTNSGASVNLNGYVKTTLLGEDRLDITVGYDTGTNAWQFDMGGFSEEKTMNLGEFASFQPTDLDFGIEEDDTFWLGLDGILDFEDVLDEVSLTVNDLRLQTSEPYLTLRSTSIEMDQDVDLFGITLILDRLDLSLVNSVLFASLYGNLQFLESNVDFDGLKIGTDGSIDIPGVSNFLQSPIELFGEYGEIDSLRLSGASSFEALRLHVGGKIENLPQPFKSDPQRFKFSINGAGVVDGGANITLISDGDLEQDYQGDDSDTSEWAFWNLVFDVYSLGVNLDVADVGNSSIQSECGVYFISNGSKSAALPLSIGIPFDGGFDVTPGQIEGQIKIDWEALFLSCEQIVPDFSSNDFSLTLSGSAGIRLLDENLFSGEINFEVLKITKNGIEDFQPCGGTFEIADMIKIGVENISFSPDAETINDFIMPLDESADNGNTSTQNLSLSSFFMIENATIDMSDIFTGSCETFLFYRQGDDTRLLIYNLEASVADVQLNMCLDYVDTGSSFSIHTGGSVRLPSPMDDMMLAGCGYFKHESSGDFEFGFFIAASGLNMPIIPGILTLDGLGGGLFYNVEKDIIDNTRTLIGLDFDPMENLPSQLDVTPPEHGKQKLAILFYARLKILVDVVSVDALLTLTNEYFSLDGHVQYFGFAGDYVNTYTHFSVGFNTFYVIGGVWMEIDIADIVTGSGGYTFWIFEGGNWGIFGFADLHILWGVIHATGDIFVGNPGFVVRLNAGFHFGVAGIVNIDCSTEFWFWYNKMRSSWGSYARLSASCSILIIKIRGSVEILVMYSPGNFYLGGCGRLKGCIDYGLGEECISASAWVRCVNGGWSGGVGGSGGFQDDVNAAKEEVEEIMAAKEEAEAALEAALEAAKTFDEEELAQSFAALQSQFNTYGQSAFAGILEMEEAWDNGGLDFWEKNVMEWLMRDIWGKINPLATVESGFSSDGETEEQDSGDMYEPEEDEPSTQGGGVQSSMSGGTQSMTGGTQSMTGSTGGSTAQGSTVQPQTGSANFAGLEAKTLSAVFQDYRSICEAARSQADQSINETIVKAQQFIQKLQTLSVDTPEFEEFIPESDGNCPIEANFPESFDATENEDGTAQLNCTMPNFVVDDAYYDALTEQLAISIRDGENSKELMAEYIKNFKDDLINFDNVFHETGISVTEVGDGFQKAGQDLEVFHFTYLDLARYTREWAILQRTKLLQNQERIVQDLLNHKNERIIEEHGQGMGKDRLKDLAKGRYDVICFLLGDQTACNLLEEDLESVTTVPAAKMVAFNNGHVLYYQLADKALVSIESSALELAKRGVSITAMRNQEYLDTVHRAFSMGIDRAYDAKTGLYEVLYDLIDWYLVLYGNQNEEGNLSQSENAESEKTESPSTAAFTAMKDEIEAFFIVPVLENMHVEVGYASNAVQLGCTWEASHQNGITDYSYDFENITGTIPIANYIGGYQIIRTTGFKSIGKTQAIDRYLVNSCFPDANYPSLMNTRLIVQARNAAGFAIERSCTFDVNFEQFCETGIGMVGTPTDFGMDADSSPPSIPVINFPDRHYTEIIETVENSENTGFLPLAGSSLQTTQVVYLNSTADLRVGWSSQDDESDVVEYKYSLGTEPNMSDVLEPASAGGRLEVHIHGLNLDPDLTYYVNVRARNGAGVWSQTGTSIPVLIDLEPPSNIESLQTKVDSICSVFPESGGMYSAVQTAGIQAEAAGGMVQGISGLAGNDENAGQSAVTATAQSGTMVNQGVSMMAGESDASNLYEYCPLCGELYQESVGSGFFNRHPEIEFSFNRADDDKSGIRTYKLLISFFPVSEYSPFDDWMELGEKVDPSVPVLQYSIKQTKIDEKNLIRIMDKNSNSLSASYEKDLLRYGEEYYFNILSTDFAGSVSEISTTGPIALNDPTKPTEPSVYFENGYRMGYSCYLSSTEPSLFLSNLNDPETGIHQVQFILGKLVSIDINTGTNSPTTVMEWSEFDVELEGPLEYSEFPYTRSDFGLEQGAAYRLQVRVVNGQGCERLSCEVPFKVDLTPPPKPQLSLEDLGDDQYILTFSNICDQESRLDYIEYTVHRNVMEAWQYEVEAFQMQGAADEESQVEDAEDTETVSDLRYKIELSHRYGEYTVTERINVGVAMYSPDNNNYLIEARSRNGAGIYSPTALLYFVAE